MGHTVSTGIKMLRHVVPHYSYLKWLDIVNKQQKNASVGLSTVYGLSQTLL